MSQICLRSVSGQSQVSLRSVSDQSQVSLRSVSGQSQVSLRSLCAYFVRQTEPKILRLVRLVILYWLGAVQLLNSVLLVNKQPSISN